MGSLVGINENVDQWRLDIIKDWAVDNSSKTQPGPNELEELSRKTLLSGGELIRLINPRIDDYFGEGISTSGKKRKAVGYTPLNGLRKSPRLAALASATKTTPPVTIMSSKSKTKLTSSAYKKRRRNVTRGKKNSYSTNLPSDSSDISSSALLRRGRKGTRIVEEYPSNGIINGNDDVENQKRLVVPSISGFVFSPLTRRTPRGDSSTVETDHAIVLNPHQTNRSIQHNQLPIFQVSFENNVPTSEITCRSKSRADFTPPLKMSTVDNTSSILNSAKTESSESLWKCLDEIWGVNLRVENVSDLCLTMPTPTFSARTVKSSRDPMSSAKDVKKYLFSVDDDDEFRLPSSSDK
jgi:hypothetical protein